MGQQSESSFAEQLLRAGDSSAPCPGGSSPAEAAEILRLAMLRSAMDITASCPVDESPLHAGQSSRMLRQFAIAAEDNRVTETPGPVESRTPGRHDGRYDGIICKASRRYGVDEGLIRAVIRAESDFNPRAVSSAGAQGLMQLMPATARSLGVTDPFDAEQNVMAGTRFLADMLKRYSGCIDSALAAYNWGPGNLDRHPTSLPRETRNYLARVKGYYSGSVA